MIDTHKVLTKREKAVLYTAGFSIAFALCFNFIFAPFIEKNADLNRQIGAARTKIKNYRRLLKEKENIQNQFKQLSSMLGDGTGNPAMDALEEIESTTKSAHVRIIEVRPQGYKQSRKGRERQIEVRAEAAMEGYFKFIYELENSLSLLRIKSFQMSSRPGSDMIEAVFQLSEVEI